LGKVLFTSYDGLTDNLGQSQVIPYITGLAARGFQISVLSCEKKNNFLKKEKAVRAQLSKYNIGWSYVFYTKSPPVISTLLDLIRMYRQGRAMLEKDHYSLIHSRTIISAVMAYELVKKFKTRFIFDMRGFWADERVESGMWNLSNPVFNAVYKFFKKKEYELVEHADHVVCLTERAKDYLTLNYKARGSIKVIPCCADLELFSNNSIELSQLEELRRRFNLTQGQFVLSYLGSLGTWYLLDEMLDFFKCLVQRYPSAQFLFITSDLPSAVLSKARIKGIADESLIITSTSREQVPLHLALSDYSIFFIQPVFAKSGSSPTKQGEIMGMGIPHICNTNVGDVDAIVSDTGAGLVITEFTEDAYKEFTEEAYQWAIETMRSEKWDSQKIRAGAFKYYSLDEGLEKYLSLYKSLI
jgi:glycosyltransferase involved in cell wall biosynthesis